MASTTEFLFGITVYAGWNPLKSHEMHRATPAIFDDLSANEKPTDSPKYVREPDHDPLISTC